MKEILIKRLIKSICRNFSNTIKQDMKKKLKTLLLMEKYKTVSIGIEQDIIEKYEKREKKEPALENTLLIQYNSLKEKYNIIKGPNRFKIKLLNHIFTELEKLIGHESNLSIAEPLEEINTSKINKKSFSIQKINHVKKTVKYNFQSCILKLVKEGFFSNDLYIRELTSQNDKLEENKNKLKKLSFLIYTFYSEDNELETNEYSIIGNELLCIKEVDLMYLLKKSGNFDDKITEIYIRAYKGFIKGSVISYSVLFYDREYTKIQYCAFDCFYLNK